MPDRLIDLFIRFVLQNHGKLSKSKQEKYFKQLSADEIKAMESVVWSSFNEEMVNAVNDNAIVEDVKR